MDGKLMLFAVAIAVIGVGGYLIVNAMEDSGSHEATLKVEIMNDTSGYQSYQMIFDNGHIENFRVAPGITTKTFVYTWEDEKAHYLKLKFIRNGVATFTKTLTVEDGKSYLIPI